MEQNKGNKDSIRIQLIMVVPMCYNGMNKWQRHLRQRLHKKVYKAQKGLGSISVDQLDSKDKMAQLVFDYGGASGEWLVMGRSHGKNRWHNKPTCLCKVTLNVKGSYEFDAEVELKHITRFWFWDKEFKEAAKQIRNQGR